MESFVLDIHECLFQEVVYLFQNQDHYAVLGLAKQRFKASDALIKKACKYMYNHFSFSVLCTG